MTDDSNADEEITRKEILTAARRAFDWRKLAVEKIGHGWAVTQRGGKGDGTQWEAVPKLAGGGWWFFRIATK